MKSQYIVKLVIATMLISCSDLFAQCFPDRHNSTWYDGWISCDRSENPNTERGLSHWILYNLGSAYTLGKTKVWNSNHPDYLGRGLKEVIIDYSIDGNAWQELGTFTLNQASGKTTYEGEEGPDFDQKEAQYVLITAISNYGGNCFGLSEFSFSQAEPLTTTPTSYVPADKHCMSVNIYPNPFEGSPRIDIKANCKNEIPWSLTDALGKQLISEIWNGQGNLDLSGIELDAFPAGLYFLVLGKGVEAQKHKLMKMR